VNRISRALSKSSTGPALLTVNPIYDERRRVKDDADMKSTLRPMLQGLCTQSSESPSSYSTRYKSRAPFKPESRQSRQPPDKENFWCRNPAGLLTTVTSKVLHRRLCFTDRSSPAPLKRASTPYDILVPDLWALRYLNSLGLYGQRLAPSHAAENTHT
jgi:hypothetical protein